MNEWIIKTEETAAFLRGHGLAGTQAGIVLGTGLGELIGHIDIELKLPYAEIPHFPQSTVEFHKGNLIAGRIGTTRVMAMQGRFHFYEGYSMQEISFPVRVMKALGVQHLLLSNAAGGLNPDFKKGQVVLLNDHINLLPENPLRGMNDAAFGPRFPDMSCPYDKMLSEKIAAAAARHGLDIRSGVYVSVMGPNLETRAEYRFLRLIGADMVGMSTIPEVIVANQLGLPCAAVSVITDECDPDNLHPVDIAEIIAVAGKTDARLSAVLADMIAGLSS